MKITLNKKTYISDTITISTYLKSGDLLLEVNNMPISQEKDFLDRVVPFLANDVFEGQFTPEEFIKHYRTPTLVKDLLHMLSSIRENIADEMAAFPALPDKAEKESGKNDLGSPQKQ